MKAIKFIILIFSIVVFGCGKKSESKRVDIITEEKNINDIQVLKRELELNGNEGNWYYNDSLFNGYAVRYHKNDTLLEKVGFYNGKKQGVAKVWFDNGVLKIESHYHQNKLIGSYKAWWNNGILASEANYEDGKLQGIEKKWYNTGELSKIRTLNKGIEDGIQKAWLRNGKLYVNYEAKNGRIFGMRRANSCYRLEDEVVVRRK